MWYSEYKLTCETFQGGFYNAECFFGLNLCSASQNTSTHYKSVLLLGSTVKTWKAVMYQMHAGEPKAILQDISISISSPLRNDLLFSVSRSPRLFSLSVFSSTTACFFRLLWVVLLLLLTPYPWPEVQCIRFKARGRCQPPDSVLARVSKPPAKKHFDDQKVLRLCVVVFLLCLGKMCWKLTCSISV